MFESAELGHRIAKSDFDREEQILRARLLSLQYDLLSKASFPVVIIIGGVDGAGKGETLNVLHEWMDPRHIVTTAFGDMSDEERERPRMWRYWNALPPKGRIGILFGAWHSDPILDRVAGKISNDKLLRESERIVRLERMLVDEGVLLLKFWFHLSKKAQRARLKALEDDPKTRWRINETDWTRFKQYRSFPGGLGTGPARHQYRSRAMDRGRGDRRELPLSHRWPRHRRRDRTAPRRSGTAATGTRRVAGAAAGRPHRAVDARLQSDPAAQSLST